jgi:DNA-directed RNA polymerase specialized sigma24 family protein
VALGALPDKERSIVELRLAGLKRAEIAEVLGLTDAAVRSAQTRAFERLRGLLADPEEHPHARA